jgi:predicted secreted hydrolase
MIVLRLLSVVVACSLALPAIPQAGAPYQPALPGYRFRFPRDHFNHPDFQTEWWYYTGNLSTAAGRRFGFELTFFREAVDRPVTQSSPWQVDDLYLAHLALSDLDGRRFYHTERLNRAGPGIAGADLDTLRIWNGNWQVRWENENQQLEAITAEFSLHLKLASQKQPVINGKDGVSQKAAGPGRASHYISLTRLAASGELELHGARYTLQGTAWMDHEFFTHQLQPEQTGWDWLSLQLDNGAEVMLYRLRRKDGTLDPYSAGTYVDPRGVPKHLAATEFTLEPGATWTSPANGARYPVEWKIHVPSLPLEGQISTPLPSQEITSTSRLAPTYWEGAIRLVANVGGHAVSGVGYLEMTGYDRAFALRE